MKITLGGTPSQSTQGASSQLGPGIHDVKFVSFTPEIIEKKDGSATYDAIKINFEGIKESAGKTYTHTVFEPKAGDDQRQDNNYGYQNPSRLEEMEFLITHLIAAVAPKTAEDLAKKEGGAAIEGWAGTKAFLTKVFAKSPGVETQIKLVADKEGRGRFPGFVLGISKKDELYPRTNFIGKNLTYTANELKQLEARKNAAPSAMPSLDKAVDSISNISVDDDLDLDLDNL